MTDICTSQLFKLDHTARDREDLQPHRHSRGKGNDKRETRLNFTASLQKTSDPEPEDTLTVATILTYLKSFQYVAVDSHLEMVVWFLPAPAGFKFLRSLCCDSEFSSASLESRSRRCPVIFPPLSAASNQTCHFYTEPKFSFYLSCFPGNVRL